MRLILIVLIATLLTGCTSYHARRPAPLDRQREAALNRIVIPSIVASNAPIVDVIAQLVKLSVPYDQEHCGCSIILDTSPTPEQQEGKSEREIENISKATGQRKITLDLQGGVPFLSVVDAMCQQAGLVWSLDTIVIVTTPEKYECWNKH